MIKRKFVRLFVSILVGAMVVFSVTGCSSESETAADEETQIRQYMSNVNQTVEELSDRLESFNDAVSREDAVTMRTQADNAFKTLDSLSSLEAPEAMSEVQQDYVDGCNLLKDALNDYVDLYTDIASGTDDFPFDYSTYDKRLSEIQDTYDKGIAALEAADELAAGLEQ